MKAPSDGWDADEREVLESDQLARALEAARERHVLGPQEEDRLLERIQREARSGAGWRWTLALAAAAVLAIGATWMFTRGDGTTSTPPPDMATAAAPVSPPAAPVFYLALEKPTIKISPAALVYRGPGGDENPLLADLKPAFDAFRAGEYRAADEEFSKLAGKYASSVEIPFYQGVARLFLGNPQGAITSLGAAERLADGSLAFDVSWYRALAEERAGNLAGARAQLTKLCAQPDTRAPTACDALTRLPQ
jgi:hypothetical protein